MSCRICDPEAVCNRNYCEQCVVWCKNFELCENEAVLDPDGIVMFSGLCMTCSPEFKFGLKLGEVHFLDVDEECSICTENVSRKILWPCRHSFCVGCSRNLLFFEESRFHLRQVDFGAPACPNGCQNPARGTQCYCDEYDSVLEQWQQEFPAEYNSWNEAERQSIANTGVYQESIVYGSQKCPLCRHNWAENCPPDM